jgi:murein DD-endopeptidase MepM/ murein hydrolase activator NlpD
MGLRSRRYTVLTTDRTGGVRGVSISLRTAAVVACSVLAVPVLIGLGAKWQSREEISQLRGANSALEIENGSFRAATGELTTQIQALENVIADLGARAELDPAQARAMQRLPAVVKAKAAGGSAKPSAGFSRVFSSLTSPEDTFGILRDLLTGLEDRLSYVRRDVERREQLAAATPSIWPAHGWLTGGFGDRSDPITGEPGIHQGIDISTPKGRPVYATADGIVESASYTGDYGNLIAIRHDFGLTTRYGHLNSYNVSIGAPVKRGDVIGYVGSTGRSTGSHLHYEILINDKPTDPLKLLTRR